MDRSFPQIPTSEPFPLGRPKLKAPKNSLFSFPRTGWKLSPPSPRFAPTPGSPDGTPSTRDAPLPASLAPREMPHKTSYSHINGSGWVYVYVFAYFKPKYLFIGVWEKINTLSFFTQTFPSKQRLLFASVKICHFTHISHLKEGRSPLSLSDCVQSPSRQQPFPSGKLCCCGRLGEAGGVGAEPRRGKAKSPLQQALLPPATAHPPGHAPLRITVNRAPR